MGVFCMACRMVLWGDGIESLLQVNFENCQGLVPLHMDFDGALDGV